MEENGPFLPLKLINCYINNITGSIMDALKKLKAQESSFDSRISTLKLKCKNSLKKKDSKLAKLQLIQMKILVNHREVIRKLRGDLIKTLPHSILIEHVRSL